MTATSRTAALAHSSEAALREIQTRTIRAVDRQLAAEVTQLKSLDVALATLGTRQAAARAASIAVPSLSAGRSSNGAPASYGAQAGYGAQASSGAQAGSGAQNSYGAPSSGTVQSAPSSGYSSGSSSLAPISIPSVAPIAIAAAPAAVAAPPVAAVTGGSHP